MSTLHLLRSSAFHSDNFQLTLSALQKNDALIFIDDGCYCLTHPLFRQCLTMPITLYAEPEHVNARGLSLPNKVSRLTIAQLVDLTFTYQRVITWQ